MLRSICLFSGSLLAGSALHSAYASSTPDSTVLAAAKKKTANACAFSTDEFKGYRLISSRYESHDTRRFYFALEDGDATMNLPIASCIVCKYTDVDGKDITRPYTPISSNTTTGRFELLIKKYPKSKMGTHIFQMRTGESLLIKGPFEKFKYQANQWSHVGMIAGGTGIAPMFQVVQGILENPKDQTKISMIYANNARRDILLANELTVLQQTYPNFNLYLTLLEVPKRWLGGIGYVNEGMVTAFMPKPGEKNTKILVCGPPPMMKAISGDKESPAVQGPLTGMLATMGYKADQVFKY